MPTKKKTTAKAAGKPTRAGRVCDKPELESVRAMNAELLAEVNELRAERNRFREAATDVRTTLIERDKSYDALSRAHNAACQENARILTRVEGLEREIADWKAVAAARGSACEEKDKNLAELARSLLVELEMRRILGDVHEVVVEAAAGAAVDLDMLRERVKAKGQES